MLKRFLISNFVTLLCWHSCFATFHDEELKEFMLRAQVETVIADVHEDKKYIKDGEILNPKRLFKLTDKNIYYYLVSLLVVGEFDTFSKLAEIVYNKYPKKQSFIDLYKESFYLTKEKLAELDKDLLSAEEKKFFQFETKILDYIVAREEFRAQTKHQHSLIIDNKVLPKKLIKEQKKILELYHSFSASPKYFPSKEDYLLKLQSTEVTDIVEKQSLALIKKKREIIFPKSDDFFELASAYKSLALINLTQGNEKRAISFIKLGQQYTNKMKSIWLEEDLIIDRPILKLEKRITKFGFYFPQWIMTLREEFANYLN